MGILVTATSAFNRQMPGVGNTESGNSSIFPAYQKTPAMPPRRTEDPASSIRDVDSAELPSNDISSRFGRRLRVLRQERRLTQAEMAKRFGIDRSYISELECGRKSVSLPTLEILAIGLGMTLSDLLRSI
ncbi:helix-turn-helix domain-containing protein [Silvibacterium sp.]|uniref:helix-turn-helix domain-containing protein n=1 Tax=Silvibacterium sp. TaxID=1964179 RepID=UPI0039E3F27B